MAHVKIDKREFDHLIGQEIDEDLLHEKASFLGVHWNHIEGRQWDVEVYPNRPDLLSVEGLARAYRGFLDIETGFVDYPYREGDIEVRKHESVQDVRPHIGCAVIRDIEVTEKRLNGWIQLQEKIHQTIGRQRDKLAIGLHDLEQIEPPFVYKAVEPEKVSFTPLEYDQDMALGEIVEGHEKGQKYAWILEDEDRYPIIEDSNRRVLSFPPIINNQLTEVGTGTTDIFIDVTGKDLGTVQTALSILVTAFSERGGYIETVEVDGEEMPDLEPEEWGLEPEYFRNVSGVELENDEIIERLEKMGFGAEFENEAIRVKVPRYRYDVMHQYDLIEDVVIAHGYDNIEPEVPEVDQMADERPLEDYTGIVRDILQGVGALETHTYALSNREKLFSMMEMEDGEIAEMSNALTEDYTCVRNWLLPSLMKVLQRNRHRSYPQTFYEVADVVKLDDSATGASNIRKMAYVHSAEDADYTDVRQVLQVIERDLGVNFEIQSGSRNCFNPDRCADIYMDGDKIGFIGEISQAVRENWGLETPVAGFEIDVEKLVGFIRT